MKPAKQAVMEKVQALLLANAVENELLESALTAIIENRIQDAASCIVSTLNLDRAGLSMVLDTISDAAN